MIFLTLCVLQLGCVAATDDNLASNTSLGLDLSQLVRKTVAECGYLEGGALRYLALYQALEPARGLHIFALHVPVDTKYVRQSALFLLISSWK